MYSFIVFIHIIASIFLILVILLQAGRGSGLSDTFGSSQMQNMFGTKSTSVLTKLTTISAVVFIFTCLALAVISSHNARSLVDTVNIPDRMPIVPKAEPAQPAVTESAATEPAATESVPAEPVK